MSNHQTVNNSDHAALRVHTGAGAQFGDTAMVALVVPNEFRQVQVHYPIVFRRDNDGGRFNALALLGFENGENLFLEGSEWDAAYRPLSMAIQPFLVGRPVDESHEPTVHIDMDHPRISSDGEGMRLFDEFGRPTPYVEQVSAQLGDLHVGYEDSAAFIQALERYELLEPFSFEVTLANGAKNTLVGFHMINEDKLQQLDGDALGALHADGHLMPIFMAVASLSNLSELVERKNRREARG